MAITAEAASSNRMVLIKTPNNGILGIPEMLSQILPSRMIEAWMKNSAKAIKTVWSTPNSSSHTEWFS